MTQRRDAKTDNENKMPSETASFSMDLLLRSTVVHRQRLSQHEFGKSTLSSSVVSIPTSSGEGVSLHNADTDSSAGACQLCSRVTYGNKINHNLTEGTTMNDDLLIYNYSTYQCVWMIYSSYGLYDQRDHII